MADSCRWLADTLVCVNIALAVRAGVCHILEVINQAGNQAAAKITSVNEEHTYELFRLSVYEIQIISAFIHQMLKKKPFAIL